MPKIYGNSCDYMLIITVIIIIIIEDFCYYTSETIGRTHDALLMYSQSDYLSVRHYKRVVCAITNRINMQL